MIRVISLLISLLLLGCDSPTTTNNLQFEFSDTSFVFEGPNMIQILEITNTGNVDLTYLFSWSSSTNWLSANPVSGTIEPGAVDTVNISVGGNGLGEGEYNAILTVGVNEVVYHLLILLSLSPLTVSEECGDWELVETPTTQNIEDIQFVSPLVGWALSYRQLMKSTNGGISWVIQRESASQPYMTGFYFLNENLGWLSLGDTLMKTQDGGASWTEYPSPGGTYSQKIYFLNEEVGWYSGNGIYKSENGGESWVKQLDLNISEHVSSFSFVNSQIGWASCLSSIFSEPASYSGYVYRTTDSGEHWERTTELGYAWWMGRVQFFNEMEGVVHDGNIFKSIDGGISWLSVNQQSFRSVFFVDQFYGWALGNLSQLRLTVNGGATFKDCDTFNLGPNSIIFFFDKQNGWAAGWDGQLLKYFPPELNFDGLH